MKLLLVLLLAPQAGFAGTTPQYNENLKLVFGIYTADKPTVVVRKFRPVLDELEKNMSTLLSKNVNIKMQIAGDYRSGINTIVKGEVDIYRLGPVSYVQAKRLNPGVQPVVMESENGENVFLGVICTRSDSKLNTIADIRNASFAFGNIDSTIGRYLAQNLLRKNGIYANDLKRFRYFDRHDQVAYAIDSGEYQAGALKKDTYDRLVKTGLSLKIITTFENVTKPWVTRSGLDPDIVNAIRSSLLKLHITSKDPEIINNPFLPTSDRNYHVTRDAIENNHLFFK